MSDRNERGERLASRLDDDSGESESAETAKTSKSAKSAETEETAESSETVKSRTNVNMYLPDELVEEVQIRFDELNAAYRREHGEPMEKNRDYYPALVRAGLEGKDIREVLGIDD